MTAITHQQEQSKAFDPFYTTKRGQGGSGLESHLVYNLVTSGLVVLLS